MAIRRKLVREIKARLHAHDDPAIGEQKQAYMKSEMPFLGLTAPHLRSLLRGVIDRHAFAVQTDLRDTVLDLWRHATYREERYAAIELCEAKVHDPLQSVELLPMYEEMIITGAWWDLVDPLASHRLRRLLEIAPTKIKPEMLLWSRSENLWQRRSAILCQLRRKKAIDLDLLYGTIEPNLSSREFFLRKAIGWALRDHAWTDPDEIEHYVELNGDRLSGLSQREALKNIDRIRTRRTTGRSRRPDPKTTEEGSRP